MIRRNLTLLLVMTLYCLIPLVGLAAEPQAAVFTLEVRSRKIVGDTTTVRVQRGDAVTLRWTTDEAVSLHLHGYDIEKALKPGAPTEFSFKAYATGRFPITAHGFGTHAHGGGHEETHLLYLEVHPQ